MRRRNSRRNCAPPTAFDRPLPVQFGSGCGGAPWRSRQFHRHRPPGAVGSAARGQQHRHARDCRALIGFTLGLLFGLIAGYFRDTWIDKVATSIAIAGVSVPHYWLGMVMVIIFSVQLNWLPAVGAGPGGSGAWGWDWEHMKYLSLPAITTSVIPMGIVTRTVRALTGDILHRISSRRCAPRACANSTCSSTSSRTRRRPRSRDGACSSATCSAARS
jgi:peptide/nickel transport system permease protein